MSNEITIPILPCHSINEMLEFYVTLGFEVTYHQSKPNTYAAVRDGDIELHFFSMREYEPAQSYSTCYVRVPDVDTLYRAFIEGLKRKYGRPPWAGIPRVIPLKNKAHDMREFILVDPGGNRIRIGQKIEKSAGETDRPPMEKPIGSPLSRAFQKATLLDQAGRYEAAAKILDAALAQGEPGPSLHRVQALVFRAGFAINMSDRQLAQRLLTEVRSIPLSEIEREALQEELGKADDLEYMLQSS